MQEIFFPGLYNREAIYRKRYAEKIRGYRSWKKYSSVTQAGTTNGLQMSAVFWKNMEQSVFSISVIWTGQNPAGQQNWLELLRKAGMPCFF
jgi:hypothetical protein